MKNLFSLEGKIAVVTGAYGQLGQQFCVSLAEQGAKIAALDLAQSPARSSAFEDLSGDNHRFRFLKADITARSQVENALTEIESFWASPNVLVNNAAIDSPPNASGENNGPFETYPEELLDKVLNVNIKGTWVCCQVFGQAMAQKNAGSIINICSIYGVLSPNQDIYEYRRSENKTFFKPASYSVSKSAILNLTRYLATYWGKKGVRVNTLTPAGIFNHQDDDFLNAYCSRMPLGRMAREDEMNGAIVFLASNASSYMTGANLTVDGGWTAW